MAVISYFNISGFVFKIMPGRHQLHCILPLQIANV